uniref:Lkrsdh1 n=1 Tax=Arundo donax TaxID=35708 RepID=A0A0A9EJL9_ARUDO
MRDFRRPVSVWSYYRHQATKVADDSSRSSICVLFTHPQGPEREYATIR